MKRTTSEYRAIPSVDSVLRSDEVRPLIDAHGRDLVAGVIRQVVERMRTRMGAGSAGPGRPAFLAELKTQLEAEVRRRTAPSVRRVINASGVIVHTNLGRAALSGEARRRIATAASYCTLEYDLDRGARDSRTAHLEPRLSHLFPGSAALAVNNNAAAVYLALHTLAGGREVVISRGELVEIGGSFRIPDVMAASTARLREVGTTNRTRLTDYESALGPDTALILKVHPSNYRILGFTEEAGIAELADLAHGRGLPLMVDQGSGALDDLAAAGIRDEPTVGEILAHGADVVTFSGDKILGGPQAGLLVGRPDLIAAMKKSPLYRVLRLDKTAIAALEATLDAYVRGTQREEVPVQRMIFSSREEIATRARRLSSSLAARLGPRWGAGVREGESRVGGGAAPTAPLPTVLVAITAAPGGGATVGDLERSLRAGDPPVIARIQEETLLLDPRTVDPAEEGELIEAVIRAAG